MEEYRKKLIKQINESPEPLRSHIHSLEAGIDSSVILHNEQLRQENKEMKFTIDNIKKHTMIICDKKHCIYIKKRKDGKFQCKADVIGIKDNKECDSYLEII